MNAPTQTPASRAPARRPAAKGNPLVPKEHGAYAQLLLPLLTALLIGDGDAAALLLAGGIVVVFLLNEPVLVLIGARGPRAKRDLGDEAKKRAAWLSLLALALGLGGLALARPATYPWVLPPLALVIPFAILVHKGQMKSLGGELLVGPMLASAALSVAVAGGASSLAALCLTLTWSATAMAATLAVREVLWRTKGKRRNETRPPAMPFALAALALSVVVATGESVPLLAALAPMPAFAACVGISMMSVGTSQLRTLGWTMIATQTLTLILLVLGLS